MSRIFAAFDGNRSSPALGALCLELLAEQRATWLQLGQAYEALEQTKVRDLVCNGFSVRLLHNPGRLASTAAPVGEADIRLRPCFLCEHHLPDPQKAILYRNRYHILSNPMPVTSGHLTIPHISHQPQAIAGAMDAFLQLAADLGQDWIILYNGPRCGASAPDHLHFQAVPAGKTPIEEQIGERERLTRYGPHRNGILCQRVRNVGREAVLFTGKEPAALTETLLNHIDTLPRTRMVESQDEPMINSMARFRENTYTVLLFPRSKHRPHVYFREGDDRIVVSPAVMEMAGMIVTPFQKDFERLDSATIETIYREVTLSHAFL